jgi:hypothetical protein
MKTLPHEWRLVSILEIWQFFKYSRNIIGRVGIVDYPAQADDYFTRVANIYVKVTPHNILAK